MLSLSSMKYLYESIQSVEDDIDPLPIEALDIF